MTVGTPPDVDLDTQPVDRLTSTPSAGDFSADDRAGRNLHFSVREQAPANGLPLSKLRVPSRVPDLLRLPARRARHEPVALMLARQPLPTLHRTRYASSAP